MENSALLDATAPSLAPDERALRLAIDHARRGNAVAARILLVDLCIRNPENPLAWLWRASLATTAEEGLAYLDQVLRIDPHNRTALGWLAKMGRTDAAPPPVSKPASIRMPRPVQDRETTMPRVAEPAVEESAQPPETPLEAQPREAKPEPEPACPVCRTVLESRHAPRCLHCRAILLMREPGDYALNRTFDVARAAEALEYWQNPPEDADPLAVDLARVTIHMNRLEYAEAAVHLKQAMQRNQTGPQPLLLADGRLFQALLQPVVMVADDTATIRDLLVRALSPAGVLPLPVGVAWDVVPTVKRQKPAVLLLDLTMPGMDGYEICRKIRGDKETRGVPVIMLTGNDGLMDKLRGRIAGATEYLTKPFSQEALLRVVKKHLEPRR